MNPHKPHFFLHSEVREKEDLGEWRFVLTAADGSATWEAHDQEPNVRGERLELLSVVRAMESLDQPSIVTLAQGARSVRRVLGEGLDEWRRNGWMWECYGELVPIKNRDLWQRLDRTLAFHRLETRRIFRIDAAHTIGDRPRGDDLDRPAAASDTRPAASTEAGDSAEAATQQQARNSWLRTRRRSRDRADGLAMSCAQLGSPVVTTSWTV
jgi:ribonuclease HI